MPFDVLVFVKWLGNETPSALGNLSVRSLGAAGQGPPGDAGRAHGEAACSAAEVAGQMRRGRVCRTRGRGLSSVLLLPEPILKAWVSYLQNLNCGQPALKHVSAL